MHPAIFLDRDNTLIENDGDLGDPEQVRLIQGAASAVASLRGLGFRVVVVSNQGGVARGKMTVSDVDAVNQRLAELIDYYANGAKVDGFYFCPYHPDGNLKQYRQEHPDRKPAPGMLMRAAEDLAIDLSRSWTIGDQMRDIEAGHAAGTRTVLVHSRPPGSAKAQPQTRTTQAKEETTSVQSNESDADEAPQGPGESSTTTQRVAEGESEVTPDFIAHSLIEAVRLIAQQRHSEGSTASGQGAAQAQVAGNRWDRESMARLQRMPETRSEAQRQYHGPNRNTHHAPLEQTRMNESAQRQPADSQPRSFRPVGAPLPREPGQREGWVQRTLRRVLDRTSPQSDASDDNLEPSAEPAEAQPREIANTENQPPSNSPRRAVDDSTNSSKTLRMILQELRAQRTLHSEFTALSMLAVVLQLMAVICLFGGLLMAGTDELTLLVRWLGAGIMIQLAVIATLMFARLR